MKKCAIGIMILSWALGSFAEVPSWMNYQGRLVEDDILANGFRTFEFSLYTNSVGGSPVYAETNTVTVNDGLFSVEIGDADPAAFGHALQNGLAYLQVTVSGLEMGDRQALAPVPLAVLSRAAETLQTDGVTYGRGVRASLWDEEAPMVILGSELNDVDETAAGSGIGGGRRNAIAIGSTFSTISGGGRNTISSNALSTTVGGGFSNEIGTSCNDTTIGGGYDNRVEAHSGAATIAGGRENTIASNTWSGSIGGGAQNRIGNGSPDCVISGGYLNNIKTNCWSSTIGGGDHNNIHSNAHDSVISGGSHSDVFDASIYCTIAGGGYHRIGTNSSSGTISGGRHHDIGPRSWSGVIGGGWNNNISSNTIDTTISGGALHDIGTDSRSSVISGGYDNNVGDSSHSSVIGGGYDNAIGNTSIVCTVSGGTANEVGDGASYSTIVGGRGNAVGDGVAYALAGGRQAKAHHTGTWIWADSEGADFASSSSNQFLVRAAGGVGIGHTEPLNPFHVAASIRDSGKTAAVTSCVAQVENKDPDANADVLALKISGRHQAGPGNVFLGCFDGGSTFLGGIRGNGSGGIEYATTGADYAEYVRLADGADAPPAGSVVGIVNGRAVPCAAEAERYMVVSSTAAVAGNVPTQDPRRHVLLAFVGQVPVRVQEPVAPGDFIVHGADGLGKGVPPEELGERDLGRLVGRVLSDVPGTRGTAVNVTVGVDAAAACGYALRNELRLIECRYGKELSLLNDRMRRFEHALSGRRNP